jgi:hypothetical protein
MDGAAAPSASDPALEEILDLPRRALEQLPGGLGDRVGELGDGTSAGSPGGLGGGATGELLDFLFQG